MINNNKMVKERRKINRVMFVFLLLTMFTLVNISLVSSDKVEIQETKGILITDANQEYIEKGENYSFDFHLSKLEDGSLITDNNTDCHLSLYGENGKNLLHENLTYSSLTNNWDLEVSGDHFDRTGEYNYIAHCSDDLNKIGGQRSEKIYVTQTGINYTGNNQIIYMGVVFLFFLVAGSFLFMSHQTQETGVKIFLIMSSFVFMIGSLASSYIIVNISSITADLGNVVIGMIFAFGLIFFTIFAYIMIKQIQAAIDMMRVNKGYEMDF